MGLGAEGIKKEVIMRPMQQKQALRPGVSM